MENERFLRIFFNINLYKELIQNNYICAFYVVSENV